MLCSFVYEPAHGQDTLQSIYDLIQSGQISIAESELNKYTQDTVLNDTLLMDIQYLRGLILEHHGDIDGAMAYYYDSCSRAERLDIKATSYLDALIKVMFWQCKKENFEECARVGLRVLDVPKKTLEAYRGTSDLFYILANSLFYMGKYSEVTKIAQRGKPYTTMHYTSKEASYYRLPMSEAFAYVMMDKTAIADSIYFELNKQYHSAGIRIDDVERELNGLRSRIEKQKSMSWASMKDSIQHIANGIYLAFPGTPDGSTIWKQYLRMIRATLEYFYFDTTSAEDESFWNWCLAHLITDFCVCCDSLPNRSCESFNNILLRKNFLEYHDRKLHKQPCTWEDVADMLDDGEAAIEISMLPNEFLILKKDIVEPLCIPIDSLLFNALAYADIHDAVAVSHLYSQDGALNKLWMLVEPYLEDINTIYISPSHLFAQFNYAAIPLAQSQVVSDKYCIKNVLSTADIEHAKEGTSIKFSNALLYGGISYEVSKDNMITESNLYEIKKDEQVWALTRGLSDETRGYLKYLPGSYSEVLEIDSILRQHNVLTKLLSGTKGNEESFKQLSINNVDLLHLSSHGFMLTPLFLSDEVEGTRKREALGNRYQTILSQSGIFLSGAKAVWNGAETIPGVEDGILTSKEIESLNLEHIKLAVLSACDTGLGDMSNLTGVSYGVHYAFKRAGVDKLLVCLWQVDDAAARLFMKYFYTSLLNTNDLTGAMKNAKEAMIVAGYDNPFYWAPFIIID